MSDEKQRSYIKRIYLVTNDCLHDGKAFYKAKNYFYLSYMNDGEFFNY